MPADDEGRVLDRLTEQECRRLLAAGSIGHLAFTDSALPAVRPVPYALHDGSVVLPARRGSPVCTAVRGAVVAFAVDSWSGADRTGWSVTAVGPARVVSTPEEVAELDRLPLTGRPPAPERCYITVRVRLLGGWRVRAVDVSGPPSA